MSKKKTKKRLVGPVEGTMWGPGTWGCHELLDRTCMILEILEEHIYKHPSIKYSKKWEKLASKAGKALAELYQEIGKVHL